jgi:hypothetical protein
LEQSRVDTARPADELAERREASEHSIHTEMAAGRVIRVEPRRGEGSVGESHQALGTAAVASKLHLACDLLAIACEGDRATPKIIAVGLVPEKSEEESAVSPGSHKRAIKTRNPPREANQVPRRMMEAEAPAHNRHWELVQHQLVQPHDEEIAIGKYGLALGVVPMGVRKAGEKGISNWALCFERLGEHETGEPKESAKS